MSPVTVAVRITVAEKDAAYIRCLLREILDCEEEPSLLWTVGTEPSTAAESDDFTNAYGEAE